MDLLLKQFDGKYGSEPVSIGTMRHDLKTIMRWEEGDIDRLLDACALNQNGHIDASKFVRWLFDGHHGKVQQQQGVACASLIGSAGRETRRRRVALYGGAFDPVTNAHLTMAAQIVQGGSADEVWLVPCGPRPDKPNLKTRAVDRYVMCQMAVNIMFSRDFPVKVQAVECVLDEALATYDLLCSLRKKHPELDFSFVIGSDWLQDGTNLAMWTSRNWDWKADEPEENKRIVTGHKMLEEFDFLVVRRPGYDVPPTAEDPTGLRKFGPRLVWLRMPEGVTFVEGNLSSTEIRNRARHEVLVQEALAIRRADEREGRNAMKRSLNAVEGLVPRAVLAFMVREKLYVPASLKDVEASPSSDSGRRPRVAVYGGAFDPITNSHLTCASEIVHSGCADEVWLVPCGPRPDKPKLRTPPLDRYCMCKIAVNYNFSTTFPVWVSDVECFSEEAFATYDLLCSLKEKHPGNDFMFIIGSDWLQPGSNIAQWESRNWDWKPGDNEKQKSIVTGHKMLEDFDFLVIRRPGYDLPTSPEDPAGLKKFGPRLSWLDMPEGMTFIEGNLSSTELRRRSAAELRWGLEGLTAPGVISYIYRQNLYEDL